MTHEEKRLRTLDDILVDGKDVLLRVDFNVPVGEDGTVDRYEDYRIEQALDTIQELQQRRCKIILITHRGRPHEEEGDFTLEPVARRLAELLKEDIKTAQRISHNEVVAITAGMDPGGILMLPNVREDEREMAGSEAFAKELALLGDVYVNEAFSSSHRAHASVAVLPRLLPSCAGRRTVREYQILKKLAEHPERPYVAIVSGSKVHTKVSILKQLLGVVDVLCVGGRIANAFLASEGACSSAGFSAEDVALAGELMAIAPNKVILPKDVVIGPAEDGHSEVEVVDVTEIPDDAPGVWDVGPKTIESYLRACRAAKTIMWNGPVGKFEEPVYSAGSRHLAEGLADISGFRIVGGGDTAYALEQFGLTDRFDHVSVGGGAMVALLEGSPMPGLEPLFQTGDE